MRRLAPLLLAVALCGCSRSYYRNAADRETYAAIAEHVVAPADEVGRIHLDPPPASRLHDPVDPDHPPKPPDDPSAALFMDCPDGRRGARGWERDGVADAIEYNGWEACLGLDDKGKLKLDADRAYDLALLHSREYQSALEDVYLAALALTLNRFEFDVHWLFTQGVNYTHFGSSSVPTETNTLEVPTRLGFTKAFTAGGQLVVDLANSFVWEFTSHSYHVNSNLLVSLAQPLLRNGGRKVRLEALTQQERNVLYAVRDFARFRKQFWANTTTLPSGYLSLLLQVQELRNLRANRVSQEQNLRLLEEQFRIRGAVSVVQVDQAFTAYQNARLLILQAQDSLENSLDDYKVRLGLPPRLPVELDDTPLRQFQLVAPELEKLRDEADTFQKDRFAEIDVVPPLPALRANYGQLRDFLRRTPSLVTPIEGELERWGGRLEKSAGDAEQRERARKTYAQFREELPQLRKDLAALDAQLAADVAGLGAAKPREAWVTLVGRTRRYLLLVDQAVSTQTQLRISLIELPPVYWTEEQGVPFAKENRLDLENSRARVTDAWRKVAVAANQLRSDLTLTASANLATLADAKVPFDFSSQASRYQVGIQFDGPLNRLAERNAYRASQITYQRERRNFMLLSDRIEQEVRRDVRALELERVRFEIVRQQLLSAARQVEASRLNLLDQKQAANTNATRDVLDALNNLLQARNALVGSYISYEQQRVRLLLDLEVLQLDDRGHPSHERRTEAADDAARPESLPAPQGS